MPKQNCDFPVKEYFPRKMDCKNCAKHDECAENFYKKTGEVPPIPEHLREEFNRKLSRFDEPNYGSD